MFLVLRTQLEASCATPRSDGQEHDLALPLLGRSTGPDECQTVRDFFRRSIVRDEEQSGHRLSPREAFLREGNHGSHVMRDDHQSVLSGVIEDGRIRLPGQTDLGGHEKLQRRLQSSRGGHENSIQVLVGQQSHHRHDSPVATEARERAARNRPING